MEYGSHSDPEETLFKKFALESNSGSQVMDTTISIRQSAREFPCPYPGCTHSFELQSELVRHVERHTQPGTTVELGAMYITSDESLIFDESTRWLDMGLGITGNTDRLSHEDSISDYLYIPDDSYSNRLWFPLSSSMTHTAYPKDDREFIYPQSSMARHYSATPSLVSSDASSVSSGQSILYSQRCPHPDCGRLVKNIKAHMLTHQVERSEKCPIVDCEYHTKGFVRKYDRCRHTLTHFEGTIVCNFCPNSGSYLEKSFNRADVFKRHLTSVHGVEQSPPNSRKKSTSANTQEIPTSDGKTASCSICSSNFANAQDLYDHLDNCVLKYIEKNMRLKYFKEQTIPQVSYIRGPVVMNINKMNQQTNLNQDPLQRTSMRGSGIETPAAAAISHGNPSIRSQQISGETESNVVESTHISSPRNEVERSALYLHRMLEHISRNLSPYVPKDRPLSEIIDILGERIEHSVLRSTNHEQSSAVQIIWTFLYSCQQIEFKKIIIILAENIERELTVPKKGKEQQEHHDKLEISISEILDLWHINTTNPMMFNDLVNLLDDMEPTVIRMIDNLFLTLSTNANYSDSNSCLRWLIKAVKQDLISSSPNEGIMTTIQKELLSDHITSETPNTTFQLTSSSAPKRMMLELAMDWDLAGYVDQQVAGLRARGAGEKLVMSIQTLGQAITLIGSATDAEALTCFEYLDRMWPGSGRKVLESTQTASKSGCWSSFGSIAGIDKLELLFQNGELKAIVDGEPRFAIEVSQIIIWLSSVFRGSDIDRGVVTCTPSICPSQQSGPAPTTRRCYRIEHRLEQLGKQGAGQCWHSMLHNPIVALGYPIKYRSQGNLNTGLEISLPIIASLIQSTKVVVLDGKLFLKGFSSMLVPTTTDSEIIRWHYMFNADGGYLSFSIATTCAQVALNSNDIDNRRHVIGWCSEAKINVGAPTSSYTISQSNLEKTTSSIAFKSFSLSTGQFVSLGTSIVLGVKDPPAHVTPVGLGIMDKLYWMENRFVVLWDSKDNRGWLVDGISALLHMLRTSLKASQNSRFSKSAFRLKETDICESNESYPQAAFDFFTINDYRNLELELYLRKLEVINERINGDEPVNSTKTKTTSVLVQDRVEYLWEVLAQIITQQIEFSKREGCYWKPQLRECLEGWDFANLAIHQSPFEPIMAKMDCFSEPWVHFIRSINAVVLFGEGFGELIQPTVDSLSGLCTRWKTLPKDKNYLATTFSTLEQIQRRYGRAGTAPMEISRGFVWYNPTDSIVPCRCEANKDGKHLDAAQVVWPSFLKTKIQPASPTANASLKANTALVFGQNRNYRWWQNVVGKFVRGLPPHRSVSMNKKRKEILDDTSEHADGSTTPDSTASSPGSQPSQSSTDATEISETVSSESSKRRKLLSSFPDLSFRPRSKS